MDVWFLWPDVIPLKSNDIISLNIMSCRVQTFWNYCWFRPCMGNICASIVCSLEVIAFLPQMSLSQLYFTLSSVEQERSLNCCYSNIHVYWLSKFHSQPCWAWKYRLSCFATQIDQTDLSLKAWGMYWL